MALSFPLRTIITNQEFTMWLQCGAHFWSKNLYRHLVGPQQRYCPTWVLLCGRTLLRKEKKILCRHLVALWKRYWPNCGLLCGCTLLKKKKKILCRHMVALWERYWHICVLLFGCTLHSFEGRHLYRYVMAMVMAVLWLKLFKILLIFTTVWLWVYDTTARLIGCCVPDLQSMYYRWPSTPRQCGCMITCGISWPK